MHKGKRQAGPRACSLLQTMLTKPLGLGGQASEFSFPRQVEKAA